MTFILGCEMGMCAPRGDVGADEGGGVCERGVIAGLWYAVRVPASSSVLLVPGSMSVDLPLGLGDTSLPDCADSLSAVSKSVSNFLLMPRSQFHDAKLSAT